MRTIFVALLSMSLTSCSARESHDCPDYQRDQILTSATDYPSGVLEVNDCLAEYGTKLAQGHASDHDVATAAVAYCGQNPFGGFAPDSAKADQQREMAEAIRVVVAARAFKCPRPRERGPNHKL